MINKVNRKSMAIRESGRSTDFISPSFGFGCLLDCSYCYMKRHTNDNSLSIAKNTGEILSAINNHVLWLPEKTANQTDEKYWTYDISCNEDFALHSKHHNWKMIFDFFKDHNRIKASFATKIIPTNLLNYDPEKKVRIRFSLMPQSMSSVLEPNTPKIIDRIKAIDAFIDAGYDVHINFSPIVVHGDWLSEYRDLFDMVNDYVDNKDEVFAECIMLTHNEKKHKNNKESNILGEEMLWKPEMQETKQSQYGGVNLRYKSRLKNELIKQFVSVHDEIIPWNKIRYIF
jgi:spore photoproduct lyase